MNGWTGGYHARAVCPVCGAWKEVDQAAFIYSFFDGLEKGSPEYQLAAETRDAMRGFMLKHLRHCLEAGGIHAGAVLVFVQPGEERYDELDPYKEDGAPPR